MSAKTKERILEAAAEIMLTKSFHSVGLNEILGAVQVPKGSFYHYFSSKEQFGVELIRHYVQEHTERLEKFFGQRGERALQKFVDYWGYVVGRMTEGECRQSCLVVKLGVEVTNFSEPMREALATGMKTWRSIFEKAIREGQTDGSIRNVLKADEAAAVVQDSWQGALQRMQVERSVAPLRATAQFLRSYLEER
ncbi:MAG: TetR/AcrR family transcriptional regulator [Acidobacteriota bacterium]|nr:TetR/AcrR family transcriptional regulator [Acidobacteriota bacterium]